MALGSGPGLGLRRLDPAHEEPPMTYGMMNRRALVEKIRAPTCCAK